MTLTLEHDYIGIGIGLAHPDSSSTSSDLGSSSSSSSSSTAVSSDSDLKTELRLGLPGSESPPALTLSISTPRGSKRGFSDAIVDSSNKWVFSANPNKLGSDPEPASDTKDHEEKKKLEENAAPVAPAAKAKVVGWPPIRSYRKNTLATNNANPSKKKKEDAEAKQGSGCLYVKVSMDGAPYLRKVDLKMYSNYKELSLALQKMFSCFTIGQCGSHGIPAGDGNLTDHGSENVLTYEDKDGDWMLVGDVPWDMFTETCRRLRIMKDSDAIGLAPRAVGKVKNQN